MAPPSPSRALGWLAWLALVAGPGGHPGKDEGGADPGPAVAAAAVCAACHSSAPAARAMRDAAGREVAPVDLWRSSMMANAARDPFWRASVAVEVAATPGRRAEIEETCLRCHAPMAHRVGLEDHGTGTSLHVLACESLLGELARDGVSCTICHGIAPEGLGLPATTSGNFRLDSRRRIFGPHSSPFAMPMLHHTGFRPTESRHVLSSELCATCHTLRTAALDPGGKALGVSHLEQSPYLEWRNSDHREEASCQSCHAPSRDVDGRPIETRIARNPAGRDWPPIAPREPFGRHVFAGANTLVLSLLRDHGEEPGAGAPAAAFDATIAATREMLRNRTADVHVEGVEREGPLLSFAVRIVNRAGHKLPTGHPSRRVWLRATVLDEAGRVVFASGSTDELGRIVGADGRPLPSELAGGPIEAHRDAVTGANEVPLYRAVMADADGEPTHVLLRAAGWRVDDRLLPSGWSSEHPDAAETAPVGTADDPDFGAGEDTVHYAIRVPPRGPLTIEVALLHQPIGARWAAELFRWQAPEVDTLRARLEEADRAPEVLATAVWPPP